MGRLGSEISLFAIPSLAVLQLHVSPFQLGLLSALEYLPFPILGLFVGVWLDRLPCKNVMVATDIARCIFLLSIPVAAAQHVLTVQQLYGIAFGTGTCTLFFDVAYASLLPDLVEEQQLIHANVRLEFTTSAARILGSSLGGVLVQLLGGIQTIGLATINFFFSSICVMNIPQIKMSCNTLTKYDLLGEMLEGLRSVANDRELRAICLSISIANLGSSLANSVLFLFYYRHLHVPASNLGMALGFSSLGFLGAIWLSRNMQTISLKLTLYVAALLPATSIAVLTLATESTALPIVFASNLIESAALATYNIIIGTYRQILTPTNLRARTAGTIRTLAWAMLPVGSLAGGLLGSKFGVTPTLLIGALLSASGALVLHPLRRLPNSAL